jgi:hypothetical protein
MTQTSPSLRIAIALLALPLLAGCQARVAAYGKVEVCSVVAPIVTSQAGSIVSSREASGDTLAGSCTIEFDADGKRGQISFSLFTTASMAPSHQPLDGVARVVLAEAQQTYGQAPSNLLSDVAGTSALFVLGGHFQQALLLDRGVLLDVGSSGAALTQEQGDKIVRAAWKALLDYRPPAR